MEYNIINTVKDGPRVSSTYAEIYCDDEPCDIKKKISVDGNNDDTDANKNNDIEELWVPPSDLLIGILDLKPPFTSKISRGKTHAGILAIGNEVLQNERAKFVKHLTTLIHENDAAWNHILQHETASVTKKVQEIYSKIFKDKTSVMAKEISHFYENSLEELETDLRSQVGQVLISAHASIVSKLNTDIKEKLEREKKVLEDLLQDRHESEIAKIKKYYKLLLNNELARNHSLINKAVVERNDALKAFYRQIEAKNITSTIYIMCTERKKCKIKKFMTENYHSLELTEKYQKIKERQDIINIFKQQEVHIFQINRQWEEKIKKILQLFLKFISFSLKLLPEQTSFLLDFEKMVILQLNEIQKMPSKTSSILIDEEKFKNKFHFQCSTENQDECTKDPFVIIGDLSEPIPPKYGSRETIPSDVNLPAVRLQRQFVYAKCHKYEEIKTALEEVRCKCSDTVTTIQPSGSISMEPEQEEQRASMSIESESEYESLLLDDSHRLNECPGKNCTDWAKRSTFPYLNDYLDFDDEKYERVNEILGKLPKNPTPNFVDPKSIAYSELPFSVTKEPYHTVETQYSSQEELDVPFMKCTCIDNNIPVEQVDSTHKLKQSSSKTLNEKLTRRKTSLQ